MAHVSGIIFVAVALAISHCHSQQSSHYTSLRNNVTDCDQQSFRFKVKYLCRSYYARSNKAVRQTEGTETEIESTSSEHHPVYHHHHHHNHEHEVVLTDEVTPPLDETHVEIMEPTQSQPEPPPWVKPPSSGNAESSNHSYFEDSLNVWYLNPVDMSSPESMEPANDAAFESGVVGTQEINFQRKHKYRRRRHRDPRFKRVMWTFFNETCCRIGCYFPNDFDTFVEQFC